MLGWLWQGNDNVSIVLPESTLDDDLLLNPRSIKQTLHSTSCGKLMVFFFTKLLLSLIIITCNAMLCCSCAPLSVCISDWVSEWVHGIVMLFIFVKVFFFSVFTVSAFRRRQNVLLNLYLKVYGLLPTTTTTMIKFCRFTFYINLLVKSQNDTKVWTTPTVPDKIRSNGWTQKTKKKLLKTKKSFSFVGRGHKMR